MFTETGSDREETKRNSAKIFGICRSSKFADNLALVTAYGSSLHP